MAHHWGYDVFVSYAHADNGIPEGTSAKFGWVTTLARNLNIGPNAYPKNLFIDHQLTPGDEFSDDLLTKVEGSALLVLLLSQNYIDSKWCGKELEHFIRTHRNDPDKPADVFVVELFPYESFVDVPPNVQSLRKRLIHAKFWHQPPDAASPVLSGYPTPHESDKEGELLYWRMLNELRAALDSRLRARRASSLAAAATPAVTPDVAAPAVPQGKTPPLGTVLLADVTEDLEAYRNAVKVTLEPEGIAVLPEGDYVGLTPNEFESEVDADLKRSTLFVQLLSPAAGRKGQGFAAPLPQLQFARAQAARPPIMQWCEELPPAGRITDPAHAKLFETEFLRVTNLASFKTEVIERVRAELQQREKSASARTAAQVASAAGKKLVFVDDLAGQPDLIKKLRTMIKQQNCDIRSLPAAAPLGNNGIDIKELLKPCRAGITIYSDRTKYATAYNRLVFFLNQIAEAHLAVARWGVYLEEGDVASVFGIESQDVVPISEQGLADFLHAL